MLLLSNHNHDCHCHHPTAGAAMMSATAIPAISSARRMLVSLLSSSSSSSAGAVRSSTALSSSTTEMNVLAASMVPNLYDLVRTFVVVFGSTLSTVASSMIPWARHHPQYIIGPLWVLSASILTTYTTMTFLQYNNNSDDNRMKQSSSASLSQSSTKASPRIPISVSNHLQSRIRNVLKNNIQTIRIPTSLPSSNLLTMYRFGGSFVIGLCMATILPSITATTTYPIRNILPQLALQCHATLQNSYHLFVPAIFLFMANFCNT